MANEVRINVTSRDRTGPGFKSARRNADELGTSTRRIGEVAAGVLASGIFERIASAATRAFTDTIAAASSLEQAVGGTQAVFGEASGAIDQFAQRSADAVGLSEREFRTATTLIGGQLKRMTGDIGFASDAAIQFTEVGADLAATYGGTTKEAVDAFAAALRGEADPAERFNLNLKISEQNAKAVELGLAETTSEVDENARAQAILALVMEQSADAQGQFARESDTHAGAQQRFTAAVEDAQAAFGQKLLPVLATGTELATDMLVGFQSLPGPLQAVVGVLAAAAALTPGILALKAALAAMSVSMRAVLVAAGPAGIALAAIGTVLTVLGQNSKEAEERQRALIGIFEAVAAAADGEVRAVAAAKLQQEEIAETADTLGVSLADLTDVIMGDADAADRLRDRLEPLIEKKQSYAGWTRAATDETREEADAAAELLGWLDDTAVAADEFEAQERDLAAATEGTTEATDQQIESLKALHDEMRAQLDPVFALTRAEEDLKGAQEAVTEAEAEHGRKSPEFKEALRQEQQAALDVLAAAGALSDEFTGDLSAAQRQMLEDAGLSAAAIEDLEDQMRTAKERADDLDGTRIQINEEYRRSVITTVQTNFLRGERHMAAGGIVGTDSQAATGGIRGNRVLVGEHRPEVVELPTGSRVIPSMDQAFDRNQIGGGGLSELRVVLELDGAEDAFVEAFRKAFRARGERIGSPT